jgi:DNA-binding NarL/FixJ family response regulator
MTVDSDAEFADCEICPLPLLPERSCQVVSALAQGFANRQIADELKISLSKVKNDLRKIAQRMGLNHGDRIAVVRGLAILVVPAPDNDGAKNALESLTLRQRHIAMLVLFNRTNKQIGTQIGIARQSVGSELRVIFDRIGVSTRLELVAWHIAHFGILVREPGASFCVSASGHRSVALF